MTQKFESRFQEVLEEIRSLKDTVPDSSNNPFKTGNTEKSISREIEEEQPDLLEKKDLE